MREKLDNKIPNTSDEQKRIKLKIDKPRGYTLKSIDVNINDFTTPIKLKMNKPRGYTLKTIYANINDFIVPSKRRHHYVRNV